MATVILKINDRSNAGKYLIGLAKELAKTSKSIVFTESEKDKFAKSFKKSLSQADKIKTEIKQGKRKGLTIDELLNEI